MNKGKNNSQPRCKTFVDYLIAIICIGVLLPMIFILAITIKLSSRGPVIYSQKRIGRHGEEFSLFKFRSMYHGTETGVPLLSGKKDKRITRVGRFMRKHRLDEIPNFVNVLKGDMTIVGPRPEQRFFIDQILSVAPEYKQLGAIKPGITSWGQVKFGYASNVDDMVKRLEYDLYYFKNRSMLFDLKIILLTIKIIIRGEGV